MKPRGLNRMLAGLLATAALAATAAPALAADSPRAWVNICGAGAGNLGVRVTVPARGPELTGWYDIQVQYYSAADESWYPVSAGGDSGWHQAGGAGYSTENGITFPFNAPSAGRKLVMRAIATVQWRGAGPGAGEAQAVAGPCEVSG